MKSSRALVLFSVLALSCGAPEHDVALAPVSLSFALPIACDAPPADLEAVAWISGSRDAVPLQVDVGAGTTTGTLRVTAGAERRIVIDWFVMRGEVRVLLGQARKVLDLTRPEEDTLSLEIAPADVEIAECLDVTADVSRQGATTTLFEGEERPPCDLDDSCAGQPAEACSNLGELCAGADPLSEP